MSSQSNFLRGKNRPLLYLIILGILCEVTEAAPPIKGRQSGPCIGMDCLHGILMHADNDQGDDHKHEDIYEKLQEQDNLRGQKIGPNQQDLLFDGVETMQQDNEHLGPEQKKQSGPNDAMTELHGVLMHGDSQHGIDHNHDHKKMTKEEQHKGQDGPDHEALHGILMHGDSELGHDHAEEHKQLTEAQHEGKISEVGDPEAQMHGGDAQHVHSDENVHIDPKHQGVPSVGDLNAALNGDFDAKMDTVTLGQATIEDTNDYDRWKKTKGDILKGSKDSKEGKDKDNGGGWGFTFPFISDTILNEWDLMKKRYLKRFYDTDEYDVDKNKEKDLRLEKPHQHEMMDDLAAIGDTGPIHHTHDHGQEPQASGDKPRKDL